MVFKFFNKDAYESLLYRRRYRDENRLVKDLINNEKIAIGQLAAQYKYVKELLLDLEELDRETSTDKIKDLLKKASRIWNYLSRTESREYQAEQKILAEFAELEAAFEEEWKRQKTPKGEYDLTKIVTSRASQGFFSYIKPLLKNLLVIENKMVKTFTRYEGEITEGLKNLTRKEFERHLQGKVTESYSFNEAKLKVLIKSLQKQLRELQQWISGAIAGFRELMQATKEFHMPLAVERLQDHLSKNNQLRGLRMLRRDTKV